jgi:tetratricopeptide (TPR) repeat protein
LRGVAFLILVLFVLTRIAQVLFQHRQIKRDRLRGSYFGQILIGLVLSFAALILCNPLIVGIMPEWIGLAPGADDATVANTSSASKVELPHIAFVGPLAPAREQIEKKDWPGLAKLLFEVRRSGSAPPGDLNTVLMHPGHPKPLAREFLVMGRGAMDRGDKTTARQLLDLATDLAPEEPDGFLLRASITEPEEWKSAARDLEIAIRRRKPDDYRAIEARLALRLAHGDTQGALEDVDVLLAARPGDVALLARRGRLRAQRGAVDGGIADLSSAALAAPGDPAIRLDLAVMRLQKDDEAQTKLALASLDTVIRELPDSAAAYLARARGRYALKRFSEAVGDASRAIQLDPKPTSADAYFLRARIRIDVDQTVAARGDLEQALKIDPKHRAALFWRGFLNLERDTRQALADFTRAGELEPDAWTSYYRGDCYLRLGKKEEAESAFADALSQGSDPKLLKLVNDGLARARPSSKRR